MPRENHRDLVDEQKELWKKISQEPIAEEVKGNGDGEDILLENHLKTSQGKCYRGTVKENEKEEDCETHGKDHWKMSLKEMDTPGNTWKWSELEDRATDRVRWKDHVRGLCSDWSTSTTG